MKKLIVILAVILMSASAWADTKLSRRPFTINGATGGTVTGDTTFNDDLTVVGDIAASGCNCTSSLFGNGHTDSGGNDFGWNHDSGDSLMFLDASIGAGGSPVIINGRAHITGAIGGSGGLLVDVTGRVGLGDVPVSPLTLTYVIDNSSSWWTNADAGLKVTNDHATGDGMLWLTGGTTSVGRVLYGLNDANAKLIFSSKESVGDLNEQITMNNNGQLSYKPIVTTVSTGRALTATEMSSGTVIATAVLTLTLPDICDSATGAKVTLVARDAEVLSVAVTDSSDTINVNGLALSADEELDSGGTVFESITLECLETNNWYATSKLGTWAEETP